MDNTVDLKKAKGKAKRLEINHWKLVIPEGTALFDQDSMRALTLVHPVEVEIPSSALMSLPDDD